MYRKIIRIFFNQDGQRVTADGRQFEAAEELVFHYGESLVLNCNFLQVREQSGDCRSVADSFPATMRFALFGYEVSTMTELFAARESADPAQNQVNLPGDWENGATADRTRGQISFRLSTATPAIAATLGQREAARMQLQVLAYAAESELPGCLAECAFELAEGVAWNAAAEVPLTAGALNAYLQTPEEYQFSGDGGDDWHDTPAICDAFYRVRKPGTAWSPALRLPQNSGIAIDHCGTLAERDALVVPNGGPVITFFATDLHLLYFGCDGNWSEGAALTGPPGLRAPRYLTAPAAEPLRAADGLYFYQLDADGDHIDFTFRQNNVTRLELELGSANPAVTGAAVLVAELDGVAVATRTATVTAAGGQAVFDFAPPGLSGRLRLRRACADAADTLRDGEPVALLIYAMGCEIFTVA